MNVALTEIQEFKFKQPLSLLFFTMVVTAGPYALNQIGYDFSSPRVPFHGEGAAGMSPMEIIDSMFRTLSGAFIHTILEWCAFSTAFFTIILSLAHYAIKRDASTPILGVALFCAGGLDAFHILAADRLVTAVADSRTLLPFTWAVSRLFNAMILIVGIRLLLSGAYKDLQRSLLFVIFVSITFGLIAYGIIYICATSPILPDTMFPDSWITRPWDIGPLLLYLFAGVYLIPSFYRQEKNFISYSILISVLPHIATQMHMAFGSSSLFDNHFNIAHFLKIFAYLIPFIGLVLEYVKTYQDQRASEVQTRTIIDTAQEAMIVIDQKGVVRVFNRFAEKMFGYSAGEVLGRNVNLLMPEPYSSEHDEYLSKYLQTGQKNIIETIRELEACRKDNTVFSIELGVNEMTLGKHKYFVGCIRDISERKTAEKKLLKAKQSAELAQEEAERANLSKSRFLANMSHEIRTPMNAILGYSQILLKRKDLDSEQLKAIQTIDSSGKNLLDMINEVLDISKIEAGKMVLNPVSFDLKELTAGLSNMFEQRCQQKGLNWKIEGLKESCTVFGDELKLRAILINLIGNAVKFTETGDVVLKIASLAGDQYSFEVIDTGIGIAKEDQGDILKPFHQEESGAKLGGDWLGIGDFQQTVGADGV